MSVVTSGLENSVQHHRTIYAASVIDAMIYVSCPGPRPAPPASIDGGTTWLPSVAVNDVPSTLSKDSYGSRLGWLGDTPGLAADSKGVFHPVWIDNRTGIKQVFTASVLVKSDRLSGSR